MASFYNDANDTLIKGTGNDFIENHGFDVTITGDAVSVDVGDGNDKIYGFNESSTLRIGNGTGSYSTTKSGSDVVVTVGTGKITLRGSATLDTLNIAGKDASVLELDDSSAAKVTLGTGIKTGDAYRHLLRFFK